MADFKRHVSWQSIAAGKGLETEPKIKVRTDIFVNNYCEISINFLILHYFSSCYFDSIKDNAEGISDSVNMWNHVIF